ncbi:MAG: glycosyltransferase family 2 protein, partial [Gemmatimonadota bacterium]|nr:glycosyltransferase family 2 protein [Gemmatimonadota bacterium]
WSALGAVPVLSGGVSAWRKDTLREMGGFTADTTHEDLDTTLRLHERFRRRKQPYRILYLPDPVLWTEVPHTWRGLYMQRKRWQRALYESLWRSRRMLFRPRYGTVGMLLMPYLLIYEAVGPFVEAASYVVTLVLLALGLVETQILLAFLAVAGGLTAGIRLSGLILGLVYYDDRPIQDVLKLSAAALLEYWIYRPFLLLPRIHAFFEFLAGHTAHERALRQTRPGAPRAPATPTETILI